jgi:hypothetical protein
VKNGTPLAAKERSIIIELLAPPVGPLPNTTGLPDAFDRPGIEKLLDNEQVTVWRYTWLPGKKTPRHFHANDVVVVHMADGVLASTTPDGKTAMNANSHGLTKFNPRGRVHEEELVKGRAPRSVATSATKRVSLLDRMIVLSTALLRSTRVLSRYCGCA